MYPLLESAQNPKIKSVLTLLEKSKERRDAQLFVVEGIRELSMALASGYRPQALFYLPQLMSDPVERFRLSPELPCYPVSLPVYRKIAYREGSQGVVAVMHQKPLRLNDLNLPPSPLVLVTEAVEKPGNIGAILRTADAAQVDAVLICDPQCDLYNPNIIRSSLGALFTRRVVVCSSADAVDWLQEHHLAIYAATLQDSVPYHLQNYSAGCALVVGSEAQGLSPIWREAAHACIRIPMSGTIDSLNVSVSAAILMFEAVRQREK